MNWTWEICKIPEGESGSPADLRSYRSSFTPRSAVRSNQLRNATRNKKPLQSTIANLGREIEEIEENRSVRCNGIGCFNNYCYTVIDQLALVLDHAVICLEDGL